MEEERLCDCGECKYCEVFLSSDYDYDSDDYVCQSCGGGGCVRCE